MLGDSLTERNPPLPSDEVVERIHTFEQDSEDDRHATIARMFAAHPVLTFDWGRSWRFRRARKLKPGDPVDHVDELVWRRKGPVHLGRANPAGVAVLYLADRRDTALSEVKLDAGDVVLTDFCIRPGKAVRVAPIGELIHVYRTGRGFLSGEDSGGLEAALNACDPAAMRALLMTDAFLHARLTDISDDYRTSSFVARTLFEKAPAIDAIAYPSRRQLGGRCFAVRTERVWDKLGIFCVRRAHAEHLAMGMFEVGDVRHVEAIAPDGSLRWAETLDPRPDTAVQLDPMWVPTE